eukprot:jgi/Galph1/3065/GphlegSOOS_G1702.1
MNKVIHGVGNTRTLCQLNWYHNLLQQCNNTLINRNTILFKTLGIHWLKPNVFYSTLEKQDDDNSSLVRAAEEYILCIKERAKIPHNPILSRQHNHFIDENENQLIGKQTWLQAKLREHLQSVTVETQKYQKKKKKLCYAILDKLGWTFAEHFLRLEWHERRNIAALILADFPVHVELKEMIHRNQDTLFLKSEEQTIRSESLVVDSLQTGWTDDVASFRYPIDVEEFYYRSEDSHEREEMRSQSTNPLNTLEKRTFDRDWQFYDTFFSGIASHPLGLEVACELRRTLNDMLLPVNAVGVEHYFSHSEMNVNTIVFCMQIFLSFLMRHIEIYFRECFLRVETVDVSNWNIFTREYKHCLFRAAVISPNTSDGEFLNRIQQPGRRLFVLIHPSALDYPLAFAEVAVTKAIPETTSQVKEFEVSWSELERSHVKDPFFVILLECFPTIKASRMGLTKTLMNMLFQKVSKHFSIPIKTIHTLSHIRGLIPWVKKQVERQHQPSDSVLMKSAEQVLMEIFSPSGKPKPLNLLNKQILEDNKQALMSICAHYLVRVRRSGGLPADSCAALHLANGARLVDICWDSDDTKSALIHSAMMMTRFCYHLDSKQYFSYFFAARNFVNTSDKVQYWLDQFKTNAKDNEFETRI